MFCRSRDSSKNKENAIWQKKAGYKTCLYFFFCPLGGRDRLPCGQLLCRWDQSISFDWILSFMDRLAFRNSIYSSSQTWILPSTGANRFPIRVREYSTRGGTSAYAVRDTNPSFSKYFSWDDKVDAIPLSDCPSFVPQ